MIESILRNCCNERKVVSVYIDENRSDCHLTGYISCINDVELILEHITPQGMYDGFILLQVNSIYRVDCEGKYEKKVDFLYKAKEQSHKKIPEMARLYDAILHFALANKLLVTLDMGKSILTGMLVEFDLYNIKLNVIDEYGNDDGIAIVSCDGVDMIVVDSDNEQDLNIILGSMSTFSTN